MQSRSYYFTKVSLFINFVEIFEAKEYNIGANLRSKSLPCYCRVVQVFNLKIRMKEIRAKELTYDSLLCCIDIYFYEENRCLSKEIFYE